jgi:hypothetical protein
MVPTRSTPSAERPRAAVSTPDDPGWLRSLEHGAIGEARARALLVDRFWVLERSVDVEGADLLVELKPNPYAPLDRNRPLARIQVKYLQDERTSVSIPARYVREIIGPAYEQFFLLVTTGDIDSVQWFLLGGLEIASRFKVGKRGARAGRFLLPGRQILRVRRYERTTAQAIADEIEAVLRRVDSAAQVRFMSGSLGLGTLPQVDPAYRLPLYNNYAMIEPTFAEMRRKVRGVASDMEETLQQLRRVVDTTDPAEAFGLLETSEVYDYQGRDGDLRYGLGEAIDWEFFSVVKDHRERMERLEAAGLKYPFVALWQRVDADTKRELRRRGPPGRGQTFRVVLSYDESTLAYRGLKLSRVRFRKAADPPRYLNYIDGPPTIKSGSIEIHCRLGGYPPTVISRPGRPEPPIPSWSQFVETHARWISDAVTRMVEARRFGDDLD